MGGFTAAISFNACLWLKNCEIMSSALVLMIKYCPASQVGSTTTEVSAFCSELTAVCCNVASRLQNWGVWISWKSSLVQRQTPLISGAKKRYSPVAVTHGMHHPCVYSGCRWISICGADITDSQATSSSTSDPALLMATQDSDAWALRCLSQHPQETLWGEEGG